MSFKQICASMLCTLARMHDLQLHHCSHAHVHTFKLSDACFISHEIDMRCVILSGMLCDAGSGKSCHQGISTFNNETYTLYKYGFAKTRYI